MTHNLYALAKQLGEVCLAKNTKIALAESCTGGSLSALITDIAGSSAWFNGSVVVYSNAGKENLIDVSHALIKQDGAVSEPVAKAMAQGVLQKFSADIALSITGIAGPGGGSEKKPVGTVCFALADKKTGTCESKTMLFVSGRDAIRKGACAFALHWMIRSISV